MSTLEKDRRYIWHPFTQEATAPPPIPISHAKGAVLYGEDGRAYLDMISSWGVNLHGHSHPKIARAIADQAARLEHVMFAGFSHGPAADTAETLVQLMPNGLEKVFFSDNGSTSVEIALKMAYQFWRNRGEENRTRFVAFEAAYHGDTFGAMSVGKTCNFFSPFEDLFFSVDFMPYADTWDGDQDIEEKEQSALLAIEEHLERHGTQTAGMIIEPLVQGPGGMRFCTPTFLRDVVTVCRQHHILVIFDEVMVGLGRTGAMFACQRADVTPDIICLAKGLTGGFLPLAATICHPKIYDAFLHQDINKALVHGHSYTANPLACAAAVASFQVFEEEETLKRIAEIEHQHTRHLQELCDRHDHVIRPRVIGDIAAFTLKDDEGGYTSKLGQQLKPEFLDRGFLIRPLGNQLYLMPPYCVTDEQLESTYQCLGEVLSETEAP